MVRLAGVDGCKGGWIAAIVSDDGAEAPVIRVVQRFADLFGGEVVPDLVAVDMPIGLPDRVQGSGRGPEQAVRALLGDRQSSVFSIPARWAVEATDYWEACALALAASDPPRKVSKQGFHLFPKIREIDGLLRSEPGLHERVFEIHPELAFRTMRGAPLLHPKKIKGVVNPEGLTERRSLLTAAGVPADVADARPPPAARRCGRRPARCPGGAGRRPAHCRRARAALPRSAGTR